MNANSPKLWLESKAYDVWFYQLSVIPCLLLIVPYLIWGHPVVLPLYALYFVLFGLPHNYLTWASILPSGPRQAMNMRAVVTATVVIFFICLLIPFTEGTSFNNVLLTLLALVSLWHAYRQHHGICKVYDVVQAKRTGDGTIFEDRRAMNWFLGLSLNGVLVWAFTHDHLVYHLTHDESYELVHPVIPKPIFSAYLVVTVAVGIWAIKRAWWDRARAGKFIPWPQFGLAAAALASYIIPYLFIPLQDIPLAIAIGTIYHNVQYFGFVWMFERYRSVDLQGAVTALQFPQRLAFLGSWKTYFGWALFYSFAIAAVYLALPRSIGVVFIYFIATSHYIVDGYVWRHKLNASVGPTLNRIARSATVLP